MVEKLILLILGLTLIISFYTDIKDRRILNVITLPAIVLGLVLNLIVGDTILSGLLFSIYGIMLGFIILFIPYIMGGIGAGDVKLLMAIGALMGPRFTFYTAIYMGLIGGVLAAFQLIKAKRLIFTIKKILYLNKVDNDEFENTIPYGVAITLGAVLTYIFI